MESKTKILGHPVHMILIVFPLGLLAMAVIFDVLRLLTKNPKLSEAAYFMIASGIVGGLVAAPFGTRDWMAVPAGTRAKKVGALHGGGNVLVLLLFAASWLLRRDAADNTPSAVALVLSFLAGGLAGVTGWLGGEMVDRLGVGVDQGAHLDAPSSLSGRPASDNAASDSAKS